MKPNSLSFRLVFGAALWSLIVLAAGGWGLSHLFRASIESAFEDRLSGLLESLIAAIDVDPGGTVAVRRSLGDPRFEEPYSGWYWQIAAPDGRKWRSNSLFDKELESGPAIGAGGPNGFIALAGPENRRARALVRDIRFPDIADPYRVVVAADMAEIDRQSRRFNEMIFWSLGLLGLGLVMAITIQVRYGLRPLAALRAGLADIRRGGRDRLEGEFPAEVAPLAGELNALLEQNASVIDRARTHVGNLAHALKTPLSVLANDATRFEGPLAESVVRQVELMRRHVDRQLARARAAGDGGLAAGRTLVPETAAALVRTLEKIHRDKNLNIDCRIEPGVTFRGERQDLEEMLGNVLDNACKWAARKVSLVAHRDNDLLQIEIEDDGPGVPDLQFGRVLKRGQRLDESVQGSGLGLAIVQDVLKLYGGSMAFAKSPLGGLKVSLILPTMIDAR